MNRTVGRTNTHMIPKITKNNHARARVSRCTVRPASENCVREAAAEGNWAAGGGEEGNSCWEKKERASAIHASNNDDSL